MPVETGLIALWLFLAYGLAMLVLITAWVYWPVRWW